MNAEALQREIEMEKEQLRYLYRLRENAEIHIAAIEKQIQVNQEQLNRKQGFALCESCHIVRKGKENSEGRFICNVCSGATPLSIANK